MPSLFGARPELCCDKCGVQTHSSKKMFDKNLPLVNDKVHYGTCIKCNPEDVPAVRSLLFSQAQGSCAKCGLNTHKTVGVMGKKEPLNNKVVFNGICISCYPDEVPSKAKKSESKESKKKRKSSKKKSAPPKEFFPEEFPETPATVEYYEEPTPEEPKQYKYVEEPYYQEPVKKAAPPVITKRELESISRDLNKSDLGTDTDLSTDSSDDGSALSRRQRNQALIAGAAISATGIAFAMNFVGGSSKGSNLARTSTKIK